MKLLIFLIYPFLLGLLSRRSWKLCSGTTCAKGGDTADVNNYRPISKLPCLAKVLESLVNNQLKSFLSIYAVLSPELYGFRAKHSIVTAISSVMNDIISAVDKRKYCAALLEDLTKAFKTVTMLCSCGG